MEADSDAPPTDPTRELVTRAGMRPFEGIRVIDITHVLAGPYATYQLALLGADVIKVEAPSAPDQVRHSSGSDMDLNRRGMGAFYITQGANKRAITLDLKSAKGREALKRLIATADVFVENFRPGALAELGLGYKDVRKINSRLVYASLSAFGQDGPRGAETSYDHVIQAASGIMAMTGTSDVNPIKLGAPAIDYATGITGAFALSAALFHRERNGEGQYIDLSMFDVAVTLMSCHVTNYLQSGVHPAPIGNQHIAVSQAYQTKNGLIMLGAHNLRQQRRFWRAVGRPDMISKSYDALYRTDELQKEIVAQIMLTRTAQEWEDFFRLRHIPASRVRTMGEALEDPQIESRNLLHRFENVPGAGGTFTITKTAFTLAHGDARVDSPPPVLGEHTEQVLKELGYTVEEITIMRAEAVI